MRPLRDVICKHWGSYRELGGRYTFWRQETSVQYVFSSLNIMLRNLSSSHSSNTTRQNAHRLLRCCSVNFVCRAAVKHFNPFRLKRAELVLSSTLYSRAKLIAVRNGFSVIFSTSVRLQRSKLLDDLCAVVIAMYFRHYSESTKILQWLPCRCEFYDKPENEKRQENRENEKRREERREERRERKFKAVRLH